MSPLGVAQGLFAWLTNSEPGFDECQACGKKLRRHGRLSNSTEGRYCANSHCHEFALAHWK